mgnify:CR=1 FL=1
MNTLGNKIKVFRKLKNFSQFELELAAGLSPGTISRIENNETNPTKETLSKLIEILELNQYESDYLIGTRAYPPTEEEIKKAIESVDEYFKRPLVFAYLLDDRNRLLKISKSFIDMAGWSNSELQNIEGKYFTEIVCNSRLKVRQFLETDHIDEILKNVYYNTYMEMYYMDGDECYEDMIKYIKSNPQSSEYWNKAKIDYRSLNYRNLSRRTINFKAYGHIIKMVYSVEVLWSSQKFRVIEYLPTNLLIRIYKRIFQTR